MMLFLLNDTQRELPGGFGSRRRNIFDPEEDDVSMNESCTEAPPLDKEVETLEPLGEGEDASAASGNEEEDEQSEPAACARKGCTKRPRFDSLFCSDSCGVSALESDLLRTFQYASDIHPSMLRN
jgi:hypothetical protein